MVSHFDCIFLDKVNIYATGSKYLDIISTQILTNSMYTKL